MNEKALKTLEYTRSSTITEYASTGAREKKQMPGLRPKYRIWGRSGLGPDGDDRCPDASP